MESATNRSVCGDRAAWELGALIVTVPFDELPEVERPAEMTVDESLAFWWTAEEQLRVLLVRLD